MVPVQLLDYEHGNHIHTFSFGASLYTVGAHDTLSPLNMHSHHFGILFIFHSHHFVFMRSYMYVPCMGSIDTSKFVSLKTFGIAHTEAMCPWENGHCPLCAQC